MIDLKKMFFEEELPEILSRLSKDAQLEYWKHNGKLSLMHESLLIEAISRESPSVCVEMLNRISLGLDLDSRVEYMYSRITDDDIYDLVTKFVEESQIYRAYHNPNNQENLQLTDLVSEILENPDQINQTFSISDQYLSLLRSIAHLYHHQMIVDFNLFSKHEIEEFLKENQPPQKKLSSNELLALLEYLDAFCAQIDASGNYTLFRTAKQYRLFRLQCYYFLILKGVESSFVLEDQDEVPDELPMFPNLTTQKQKRSRIFSKKLMSRLNT